MRRALVFALLVACTDRSSVGGPGLEGFGPRATAALRRVGVPRGDRAAVVRFAARADGESEIETADGSMAVAFKLLDAKSVRAAPTEGRWLARGALPQGDLVRGDVDDGGEDLVVLRDPSAPRHIAYEIRLTRGVAGLRLVADTLEMVDAGGAPRLRVPPPWVIDAHDVRHPASLALRGCAYDRSAAPGATPIAPRSDVCVLEVTWPEVAYPALLDPAWATTASMSVPRQQHAAIRLGSGKVLVSGGGFSSAEIYDPATHTWSATGTMSRDRQFHSLTALSGGKLLAVGGIGTSTVEIYDESTGNWTSTTSLPGLRDAHAATALADGRVLVAGGGTVSVSGVFTSLATTAVVYDPSAATWTATGPLAEPRAGAVLVLLGSGKVWLGTGLTTYTDAVSTNELFDPATNTWTASGALIYDRTNAAVSLLPDGKILVAGGETPFVEYASTEIVDPAAGSVLGPSMAASRSGGRAAILPNGQILITGGSTTAEVFDPPSRTLRKSAVSSVPRTDHVAVALLDGRVLVAGGNVLSKATSTAEVYDRGISCSGAADCGSGFCVDGVCCETACDSQCEQCALAPWKGFCSATPKGSSPAGSRTACGTGVCAGTCGGYERIRCTQFPDASTSCAAAACSDASHASAAATCTGSGTCATATVTDCGAYACEAGACRAVCTTAADCAPGYACIGTSCQKGGIGASCASSSECSTGFCVDGTCCVTSECTAPERCDVPGRKGACSRPLGASCTTAEDCGSGFCTDGVCCNAPCAGRCEACDATGTCAPIVGAPRGTRPACEGTGPCAGACDGVARESCTFPGAAVSCGAASCTDGFEHAAVSCDGAGSCAPAPSRRCEPYACGEAACRTKCAGDGDCASGYSCDPRSGRCVFGAKCDGDHSVFIPGARPLDCAPFRCAGSKCLERCASTDDCMSGFVCNVTAGTCDAPTADDGGSGCAVSRKSSIASALVILTLALAGTLRRHRR